MPTFMIVSTTVAVKCQCSHRRVRVVHILVVVRVVVITVVL